MKHFLKSAASGRRLVAALALAAVSVTSAAAASKVDPRPIDYRRTLHAAAGQDRLVFEAPLGMCFLDPSDKKQGPVYDAISAVVRAAGHSVVVGVFAPCESLVNAGNPMGPEGDVVSTGIITWANPAVGGTLPSNREDYLDFRAASFREYVALNLMNWGGVQSDDTMTQNMERFALDHDVHRTDSGVSLGFSQKVGLNAQTYKIEGVAATTLLRHHPVEILLRLNNTQGYYDAATARRMMDTLLAQEVALNPAFQADAQ